MNGSPCLGLLARPSTSLRRAVGMGLCASSPEAARLTSKRPTPYVDAQHLERFKKLGMERTDIETLWTVGDLVLELPNTSKRGAHSIMAAASHLFLRARGRHIRGGSGRGAQAVLACDSPAVPCSRLRTVWPHCQAWNMVDLNGSGSATVEDFIDEVGIENKGNQNFVARYVRQGHHPPLTKIGRARNRPQPLFLISANVHSIRPALPPLPPPRPPLRAPRRAAASG